MTTEITTNTPRDLDIPKELDIIYQNPILPTVGGIEIWERLGWETVENYKKFRAYRELGVTRTLFQIAAKFKVDPLEIVNLSEKYHWKVRVDGYDIYEQSHYQQVILQRQRDITESHYQVSQELFQKCAKYCSDNLEDMGPNQVIKVMGLAAELGKQAVGLGRMTNSNQSSSGSGLGFNGIQGQIGAPTVHITNQQLNQTQTSEAKAADDEAAATEKADREKVAGILNIMNKIGVFTPKQAVVEEMNMEDVIITDTGGLK